MSPADRYAVIGHPIAHSLSPRIHALFAQQTHQNMSYEALDVLPERLADRVGAFFAGGGQGLNVTVPHKQAVLALVAELSERALRAGAVNTLALGAAGHLFGDNTDGVGLVRDLCHNLQLALGGRRVLLLGAGGAARGVLAPLLALAPAELVVANRSVERARSLAEKFAADGPVKACSFDSLGSVGQDGAGGAFDLIVNATAASLHGQLPPLPPHLVGAATIGYDMVYGRKLTPFTRWARSLGARDVHMGLGMLVEQAAESFQLWRAVRPDTAAVLATLRGEGVAL